MERKLRLGVIGCGRIAQAHFAVIENLKEKVDLIAVADADEKREQGRQRNALGQRPSRPSSKKCSIILGSKL
jgi:predicted dehydrogenase